MFLWPNLLACPAPTPETPPSDCPRVLDLQIEDLPAALQRRIAVTLDRPVGPWVTCTAVDDPEEILLIEPLPEGTTLQFDLHGLYADTIWACEIHLADTCDAHPFEIDVPPLGTEVPGFAVTGTPTGTWTLFNAQRDALTGGRQHVLVVDPQGRPRWIYDLSDTFVGDIDASWTGDRFHLGGGWGMFDDTTDHQGLILQLDRSGAPLLDRRAPAFGLAYNHHSEVMPDGDLLSLTSSYNTLGADTWFGVAVERLSPDDGTTTWTWDSQVLVDAGLVGPLTGSPWHANSLTWRTDPLGEAVWISLYNGQTIWRIDVATGERTHRFGHDGDFVLLDPVGDPLPPEEWAYGQHDPDYDDAGHVLLYDNGVDRPGGSYSRVVEYLVDLEAQTATLLWSWTEPGWYTPVIGDADWLDSGNVLITKGAMYQLTPGVPDHSALIEVDPTTDAVVWRLDFTEGAYSAYRAQRYDGCEIFRSAKHCSDVEDRLAALRDP